MNKARAKRPCTKNGVYSITINNVEVDMIGSLPDEVLTHILSFLTTKEAVQTCVLSKRWKNTCAVVPIPDTKQKHCSGNCKEGLRMSVARFEWLMTGFLDNRAPTNLVKVCCVRHIKCFEPDAST